MNKFAFLLLLLPAFTFAQPSSADKKLILSVNESEIQWTGKNVLQGGHTGTLKLTSGNVTLNKSGVIEKGDFVIDMTSMASSEDIADKSNNSLIEHLKSDDFFSVDKFPKAFFSITKVTPLRPFPTVKEFKIEGFLAIKSTTNTITFEAIVINKDGVLTADAKTLIFRTRWGITYEYKTFINDLKDGGIADDIGISLHLVFRDASSLKK